MISANPKLDDSRREQFLSNPTKALWTLAVPIMIGMSIQILYSITDLMFIGWVSSEALSAVSFNIPLVFLVLSLTMGLGSGVTAVIARAIGAGDKQKADNSALHGFLIGLTVSILFTGVGLFAGPELLRLIGAPAPLLELAWSYLYIIVLGLPFWVLSSAFGSILAGEGDTRFPMMISGLGMILNMVLDPLFIFGFQMGLRGAATATTLSYVVVFGIFVYLLFGKRRSYITFSPKAFVPSGQILKEILSIGFPASASMLIMSVGSAVFNRILVYYSASAVAAYQIAGRVDMIIFLPIIAIASALVTLVGMFWGAGNIEKLKFIVKYGMSRAVLLTVGGSVLVYIFSPAFVRFFTSDIEITRIAISYLRIVVFVYPLVAISMTSGRVLQGLGKGTPVMIITCVRILLVSAPLASLSAFVLHQPIVWIWYSLLCSVVVSACIALWWVRDSFRRLEYRLSQSG